MKKLLTRLALVVPIAFIINILLFSGTVINNEFDGYYQSIDLMYWLEVKDNHITMINPDYSTQTLDLEPTEEDNVFFSEAEDGTKMNVGFNEDGEAYILIKSFNETVRFDFFETNVMNHNSYRLIKSDNNGLFDDFISYRNGTISIMKNDSTLVGSYDIELINNDFNQFTINDTKFSSYLEHEENGLATLVIKDEDNNEWKFEKTPFLAGTYWDNSDGAGISFETYPKALSYATGYPEDINWSYNDQLNKYVFSSIHGEWTINIKYNDDFTSLDMMFDDGSVVTLYNRQ